MKRHFKGMKCAAVQKNAPFKECTQTETNNKQRTKSAKAELLKQIVLLVFSFCVTLHLKPFRDVSLFKRTLHKTTRTSDAKPHMQPHSKATQGRTPKAKPRFIIHAHAITHARDNKCGRFRSVATLQIKSLCRRVMTGKLYSRKG